MILGGQVVFTEIQCEKQAFGGEVRLKKLPLLRGGEGCAM